MTTPKESSSRVHANFSEQRLEKVRHDFVEKISVAGWKEAFGEQVSWISHCFKAILLVLSGVCLYCSFEAVQHWLSSGYTDEVSLVTNIESLPFSNVTICAQLYFNESFIKKNVYVPPRILELYPKITNQSLEEFYQQLTLFLSQISRPRSFTPEQLTYFSQILHANQQMRDYSNFVRRASLACEEMFRKCWFGGKEFNCCEKAVQSIDDDGTCYLLALNFDSDNAISNVLTVHQTTLGPAGGLRVDLSIPVKNFPWLDEDAQNGFRVYVNPTPFSLVQSPLAAPHGAETFIIVTPSKHKLATKCAPPGHLSLEEIEENTYYDPNGFICCLRVFQDLVRKYLQCEIPFYLQRPNSSMACSPLMTYVTGRVWAVDLTDSFGDMNAAKLGISVEKGKLMMEKQWKDLLTTKSICPSHCEYWSYESSASFIYMEKYSADEADDPDTMFGRIHISYGRLDFRQHEETEEVTFYLALCDFGNVVGLYWGMSFISFFHVVVYVPRYVHLRRKGRRHVELMDE